MASMHPSNGDSADDRRGWRGTYIHLHFVHSLLEFSRAILVAGDHFSETVLHHCWQLDETKTKGKFWKNTAMQASPHEFLPESCNHPEFLSYLELFNTLIFYIYLYFFKLSFSLLNCLTALKGGSFWVSLYTVWWQWRAFWFWWDSTHFVSEDVSSDGSTNLNDDDQRQQDGKLRANHNSNQHWPPSPIY